MIRNSFLFLDRVGKRLEQHLWNQGIHDWDAFLNKQRIPGLSTHRKGYYDRKLKEAQSALYRFDSSYFLHNLPASENYRLYDFFKDETVFLDIETSGLSPYYNDITMVGLYDGFNTKIMIKGMNLDQKALQEELSKYKMIVTFNGASFDLPFIEKQFPKTLPQIPHWDLRSTTKKLGLTGGLKNIERQLNIERRELVSDLTGGDALTLWRSYRATNDEHYLNLLIEYNEEDIINLKKIAEYSLQEIRKTISPMT